jgi:UDP:flavonoid glycosyltransferase YjiC (YdhE family)
MARILLAWELGANLGHIAPLRALALQLRARGHDCAFAVRDLDGAEEFLEPELGPVFQAPVRLSAIQNPLRVQVSYASLLHNTGFDDALSLAGRLRAWRQLMQNHCCDLLVCDHAPTAHIAAGTLGIPVLQLGAGFMVPPLAQPFPVFRPNTRVSTAILAHNEAAVLKTLCTTLKKFGAPCPETLQDAFRHASRALITYAELDHYDSALRDEPYLGLPMMTHGAVPEWPAGNGPKLFAYLRPSKDLQALLTALGRMPMRVLVRIGSISAGKLKSFERPGMVISDQPLDIALAVRDCDACINYASHGMVAEMLLAGKPGLLLPDNVERSLAALRVQQLGAGLSPPAKGDFNLSQALRRIVDDPTLKNAAQAFAARYRSSNRALIMPQLAERALALIKTPQRGASAGS